MLPTRYTPCPKSSRIWLACSSARDKVQRLEDARNILLENGFKGYFFYPVPSVKRESKCCVS